MAKSLYGAFKKAMRDADKADRADQRQYERELREQIRKEQREDKAAYNHQRSLEVIKLNEELGVRIALIKNLLKFSSELSKPIDFVILRKTFESKLFDPVKIVGPEPEAPSLEQFKKKLKPPGVIGRLFGGDKRYEGKQAKAERRYEEALKLYNSADLEWQDKMKAAQDVFNEEEITRRREIEEHNRTVDDFEKGYISGNAADIENYFSMVLKRAHYPDNFPRGFRVGFEVSSKRLLIAYLLPSVHAIPKVGGYSYIKTRDEIKEKDRSKTEVAKLYRGMISTIILRTIREVYLSDSQCNIRSCVINGFVKGIYSTDGKTVCNCVISISMDRGEFKQISFNHVDPIECVKRYGLVAMKPEELTCIDPIVDFNLLDNSGIGKIG